MVPSGPSASANTGSGFPSVDDGAGAGGAWGDRVVATGRPGVAARQPAHREPAAADAPVLAHGLEGVRRAARVVAADLAVERADDRAVGAQQPDQDVLHDAAPVRADAAAGVRRTLWRQRASSARSSAL